MKTAYEIARAAHVFVGGVLIVWVFIVIATVFLDIEKSMAPLGYRAFWFVPAFILAEVAGLIVCGVAYSFVWKWLSCQVEIRSTGGTS